MLKKLMPLALVAAAVYYFRNTSQQNRYVSGLKAFGQSLDVKAGRLLATIRFQNPNTMPATVRSVVGGFLVNGVKVANVSTFKTIVISGNAETLFPVDVELKVSGLITTLAQLTKNMAGSTAQFKGVVNVNNTPVPYTVNFALK